MSDTHDERSVRLAAVPLYPLTLHPLRGGRLPEKFQRALIQQDEFSFNSSRDQAEADADDIKYRLNDVLVSLRVEGRKCWLLENLEVKNSIPELNDNDVCLVFSDILDEFNDDRSVMETLSSRSFIQLQDRDEYGQTGQKWIFLHHFQIRY